MSTPANSQTLLAVSAGPAQGLSAALGANAPAATPLATPAQAVESVLQIADIQAAQSLATPAAINLHFTVGGENLSVRVALQEGQVHTQFTTDSSELRTALAHEWQAVSPDSTGTVRFAEPVFTAGQRGESKAGADTAGEGGQQANRGRDESGPGTGSPGFARPARAAQAATAAAPSRPVSGDPIILGRLNSFA